MKETWKKEGKEDEGRRKEKKVVKKMERRMIVVYNFVFHKNSRKKRIDICLENK